MKYWLLLFFIFYFFKGFAQDSDSIKIQSLIKETVFSKSFINKEPLSLDSYRMVAKQTISVMNKDTNSVPDLNEEAMSVFKTLLNTSDALDTTSWKDNELVDCALVSDGVPVNPEYVLMKFKAYSHADKSYYRKIIKHFNLLDTNWEALYSFSRPIIDSTGKYAIVAHTYLRHGFGCAFLKWNGVKWKEILNVSTRD